jgi:hypothetical protein
VFADIGKNDMERVKMICQGGWSWSLQEKMKHNKMSVTERKQKRADGSVVRMFTQER